MQSPSLQQPLLRLPPGLAVRLAAAAASRRPLHPVHGPGPLAGAQRGGGPETGVRLQW